MWDVHLATWTSAAVAAGLNVRQTDFSAALQQVADGNVIVVAGLPVREEAGPHGPGAIGEQLDGGLRGQPAHGHQDFPGNAERLPAGGDQPEAGYRSERVSSARPPRR